MTTSKAVPGNAIVCDMTLPWAPGANGGEFGILERFHAAGIDFISLTVAADFHPGPQTALLQIAGVRRFCADHPDRFVVIDGVDDILAAKQAGKLALSFNLQGTNPLAGETALIEIFYRLGVRHMLLAYNKKNFAGDGCAERTDAGLSRFGLRVVAEMNRVGMLVCGTHTGRRTTLEAMEASTAPCIFSHSNAYGVFAHYRNLHDDQIKACARTGGVIGVNGLGAFLEDMEARTESMFRHVDYIANLVGPEHAGIGLDYIDDVPEFWRRVHLNPDGWPPNNSKPHLESKFAQPEQVAELAEMMLAHGYGEDRVRGILGGNFLRVARKVWK